MLDIRSYAEQLTKPLSLSILLPVLFVAGFLRFWQIDSIPPGFHFDESFEGLEAWRILTDSTYRPLFLTGNFGVPPLNAYANALTFHLFTWAGGEAGPTAMRVTAACFGMLGIISVYALAIELRLRHRSLSHAFPLFAAAVLAGMRWHIHFSRMGIEPIIVPVIWAASSWLFLRGWRTGNWFSFAGCGVLLALGMYTYQGAWVIPFLMIPIVIHFSFQPSAFSSQFPISISRLRGLLITAAIALLLFLPLGWFFWQNMDVVFLRPTQLAIVGETGSPADATVGDNVWATAKMFGPFGSPGDLDPRRNLPGESALNLWFALPFYMGLGLSLWRLLNPAYSLILVGLVGLLAPGIFSEYAPHFHRILGASAPAALLCAVGLDQIWRWVGSPEQERAIIFRRALQWLTILLVVAGTTTSAWNYFGRWAKLPDLFHAFDVGLWEIGRWVATEPEGISIYLTPRTIEHPTLAFAWQTNDAYSSIPTSFDGRHIFPLSTTNPEQPEHYIVIEPEDFRTRLLLPDVFPNAYITHEIFDLEDQIYARVYTRPVHSQSQRHPQIAYEVMLGDGIELMGYDVQPEALQAGNVLYLQLYWQVHQSPTENWTVYTHLIEIPSNSQTQNQQAPLAGYDSPPGAGSLPTTHWQPGWRILDEYQMPLPPDLLNSEYQLRIGMYGPEGQQLPSSGQGVLLGSVKIGQEE